MSDGLPAKTTQFLYQSVNPFGITAPAPEKNLFRVPRVRSPCTLRGVRGSLPWVR